MTPRLPRFRTSITVLARLRPDVTPERARLMLESQWQEITTLPPGFREEWRVRPLHDRRVGDAPRVAIRAALERRNRQSHERPKRRYLLPVASAARDALSMLRIA
ncbi:MAG TPA: hypothetical protein VI485_32265 [Vicinamibacterales bacterium]|nr:hypothetical protein [Vicinamibacterales bacterium]